MLRADRDVIRMRRLAFRRSLSVVAFENVCNSEFLKDLEGAQSFGLCLFRFALPIPNPSLQKYCATEVVRDIYGVKLGLFDVGVRFVWPAFLGKEFRQGVTSPEQLVAPVKKGCNSEGDPKMLNGVLPGSSLE